MVYRPTVPVERLSPPVRLIGIPRRVQSLSYLWVRDLDYDSLDPFTGREETQNYRTVKLG